MCCEKPKSIGFLFGRLEESGVAAARQLVSFLVKRDVADLGLAANGLQLARHEWTKDSMQHGFKVAL
jgi:hypothetical protein